MKWTNMLAAGLLALLLAACGNVEEKLNGKWVSDSMDLVFDAKTKTMSVDASRQYENTVGSMFGKKNAQALKNLFSAFVPEGAEKFKYEVKSVSGDTIVLTLEDSTGHFDDQTFKLKGDDELLMMEGDTGGIRFAKVK